MRQVRKHVWMKLVLSLTWLMAGSGCGTPATKPMPVAQSFTDEDTDIPVLLDFGVTGGPRKPCYCVAGPCRDLPTPPSPVLRELLSIEALPAKRSFRFSVPDASRPFHIFLYVEADGYNKSELKLNDQSVGRFSNSTDFYYDRHAHFQNLSVQTDNVLDLEIQGTTPIKLKMELVVRPEDPRLAYCIGEATAWKQQNNQGWKAALAAEPTAHWYVSILEFYSEKSEVKLNEFASHGDYPSVEYQSAYFKRWNRIGSAVKQYQKLNRRPLKAVGFSSLFTLDRLVRNNASPKPALDQAPPLLSAMSESRNLAAFFAVPAPVISPVPAPDVTPPPSNPTSAPGL